MGSGITVEARYDRDGKDFVSEDKTDDDGDEYDQYVEVAESPEQLLPGDTVYLDSAVTVMTVASNGHVRGATGKYDIYSLEENGYSVSLHINYRSFNYFIGGVRMKPASGNVFDV